MTTAGNSPAPSGLKSLAGICSDSPVPLVVPIDKPAVVELHPASYDTKSTDNVTFTSIVFRQEQISQQKSRACDATCARTESHFRVRVPSCLPAGGDDALPVRMRKQI